MLEAEINNRHQSTARRLLREARFADVKTFDQIDWAALKCVSRPKLMELASCGFIGRAEDYPGRSDRHWKIARCDCPRSRGHPPASASSLHARRRPGAELGGGA